MAITYKSQGAGVATESSGAALSPLCPATVDAGDILIAHVYWEGTTTAPSTPGDWTLLHGPEVIQSTIARHWVFGKIADGTEDGAAVAFGSPAVTTQRGARVYSFAGRIDGTITEIVNGFAATSHATDPQMPTVITDVAGALAVALVGQNDNNTSNGASGETGGDWTEPVAEFTAALTPGLLLAINTATPTADPGTISGGSIATTNDPCGVIGFQVKQTAGGPAEVLPGVGALDLTGFAPTVVASNHKNVLPGLGALDVTGFAPTVVASDHKVVLPGVGALDLEGFAPTIAIGVNVQPDVGSLDLTGFAPTVVATANVNVQPDAGALTLDGFAPAVTVGVVISPDVGALILTGYAPLVAGGATTYTWRRTA